VEDDLSNKIPNPLSDFSLLKRDIIRQADLLANYIPRIREQAKISIKPYPKEFDRIYLTGCGDSYNVGMATRWVWEKLLRIPVEALPAMTFSRFAVQTASPASLVVALSQSGKVNRVVEAIRVARRRGLKTLSVTGQPDSPLAREPADSLLVTEFPKLGFVPGTTSYAHGLVTFYELASALLGDLPQAIALQKNVDTLPELIASTLSANWTNANDHAAQIEPQTPILILASGSQLANAKFTARKFFEITQNVALSQESEEYAHDEYSIINSSYAVILIAPNDAGFDRHVDLANYLHRLGVHLAVITSQEKAQAFQSTADIIYEIPPVGEDVSPVLYALPPQMLISDLAMRIGGSYYSVADRLHAEDGDSQIYTSAIIAE
jgi:glucosamine--fructose-6-phosphate aminotransferase (isomerizing)